MIIDCELHHKSSIPPPVPQVKNKKPAMSVKINVLHPPKTMTIIFIV